MRDVASLGHSYFCTAVVCSLTTFNHLVGGQGLRVATGSRQATGNMHFIFPSIYFFPAGNLLDALRGVEEARAGRHAVRSTLLRQSACVSGIGRSAAPQGEARRGVTDALRQRPTGCRTDRHDAHQVPTSQPTVASEGVPSASASVTII